MSFPIVDCHAQVLPYVKLLLESLRRAGLHGLQIRKVMFDLVIQCEICDLLPHGSRSQENVTGVLHALQCGTASGACLQSSTTRARCIAPCRIDTTIWNVASMLAVFSTGEQRVDVS